MLLLRFVAVMLAAGLAGPGINVASGQDFPSKPIRIITSSAGGGSDFASRLIAQGISGPLGQPVVVDNRGSGILAAEVVYKLPPDGYALTVQGSGLWIFTLLQKAPFDAIRDFSPLSLLVREVSVVAVHPSLPVKSVKELIALAKTKPGELNYSSASAGGSQHLSVELFRAMSGINIVRIPYKGNAPAITALMSGEAQLTIFDAVSVAPHIKSGRLRALAVTSPEPSALVPGLPTVAATGLPGYEWIGMTVILAPAKTPTTIINRLNQEIVRVLRQPDVKERFLAGGTEPVGSSPEELATIIKTDITRLSKVIKDANIKID